MGVLLVLIFFLRRSGSCWIIHVCMHLYMRMRADILLCVHIHICVYIDRRMKHQVCMCVCVCVCVFVCVCVSVDRLMYRNAVTSVIQRKCMRVCVCVRACMCEGRQSSVAQCCHFYYSTYVCVCVCVCVCVYV